MSMCSSMCSSSSLSSMACPGSMMRIALNKLYAETYENVFMTVTYYFTYKSSLHTILHTNDDYAKLCYFMLNYAPYAKLCSAMLLLCKLCLMLGLCDYAKKQCWHNRAAPRRFPSCGLVLGAIFRKAQFNFFNFQKPSESSTRGGLRA